MRAYGHETDDARELRPRADSIESEDPCLIYRAAAAGRTDVLGPTGPVGLQRAVGNAAMLEAHAYTVDPNIAGCTVHVRPGRAARGGGAVGRGGPGRLRPARLREEEEEESAPA